MSNSIPKKIAVLSRSFSKHPLLRTELQTHYADVRFNDTGRTLMGDELVTHIGDCDGAIVALEKIDAATLDRLPSLKVISKYGVGLDNVDLEAVSRKGIRIGWTGGVNRVSVSELTICLIIASLRHVSVLSASVRAGVWQQKVGRDLRSKTVGVLGCGHVGQEVVRLLRPFQCRLLAYDQRTFPEFYERYGVEAVGLDTLFKESDVITIHLPVTPQTTMLIDAAKLDLMRRDAVLINTARGGLVDEQALKACLINGRLGAAAMDVFQTEPPDDFELLSLPNLLVTPHIGGSSAEAILEMGRAAISGLCNAQSPSSPGYIPPWVA